MEAARNSIEIPVEDSTNSSNSSGRTSLMSTTIYRELKHIVLTVLSTAYVVYGLVTNSFENILPIYLYAAFIIYELNRLNVYQHTIYRIVDLLMDIFEENIYRDLLTAFISFIILVFLVYQCVLQTIRIYPLCCCVCLVVMSALVNLYKFHTIHWNVVMRSINMHFLLAFIFFYVPFGRTVVIAMGQGIMEYLKFSEIGSSFVYGHMLIDQFIFAFYVLSSIYLSFMTIAILRHIGFLDYVVCVSQKFAFCLGISPIEGVIGVVNIFMSMTDLCIVIRGRLTKLCTSELFALMVTGLSTISFTALFGYVSLGANIDYLITSSIITIPCCFAFAKIFQPNPSIIEYTIRAEIEPLRNITALEEDDATEDGGGVGGGDRTMSTIVVDNKRKNLLDRCIDSITEAGTIIQVIIGNIIAIMSFVNAVDYVIRILMSPFATNMGLIQALSHMVAYFLPLLGVDGHDARLVAEMFVQKVMVNEFVAYKILGKNLNRFATERSIAVANVIVCGFGNISAASMLSAIIKSLTNNRVNVSGIMFKALCVSCIVNIFCSCTISILMD